MDHSQFDWLCVPDSMLILDDEMLRVWVPEFSLLHAVAYENAGAYGVNPGGGMRRPLVPSSRFNVLTSEEDLATLSKGFVPPNTQANTLWAVRNFSEWAEWRSKSSSRRTCACWSTG